MVKRILVLDFDGVIHSYTSGWTGVTEILDPPVEGALQFLEEASKVFNIMIFSSRSSQPGGIKAMADYIQKHLGQGVPPAWFREIGWPVSKPPAFLTIDDRAITFEGKWPSVPDLLEFKPWNKRNG